MRLEIKPYVLEFKFNVFTSRGQIKKRKVWFLRLIDSQGNYGIGEVAPIRHLSPENIEAVPTMLKKIQKQVSKHNFPKSKKEIASYLSRLVGNGYPSIFFGLELALLDYYSGGNKNLFDLLLTDIKIPINGLIWMGSLDFMQKQIKEKLEQGFRCIKIKIGNHDFEDELKVLKELRSISSDLIIKLDANGAFQANEVLSKLRRLEAFKVHSIEQPILPRQPEEMQIICKKSQIPIAFDEELIGLKNNQERTQLIQDLKPHYLVLKPTLLGGFSALDDWIKVTNHQGIGWWITSYLESNIGLSGIAQYTSLKKNKEYSGLGTGGLYHNNLESPLLVKNGFLSFGKKKWSHLHFDSMSLA